VKPCRLWTGSTNGVYGSEYVPGRGMVGAHRMAWERAYGPIPAGMNVCHSCDVPLCIEPTHLWIGTDLDNMRDAKAKGRLADPSLTRHPGVLNGRSKLTPEQVDAIRARCHPAASGGGRGPESVSATARRLGISRTLVRLVLQRKVWA
jgi:HNH endonuclease